LQKLKVLLILCSLQVSNQANNLASVHEKTFDLFRQESTM
jgi:hypothetical protein